MERFLEKNNLGISIEDPGQARVLQGIREEYYSDEEIKDWLKKGKIRDFRR